MMKSDTVEEYCGCDNVPIKQMRRVGRMRSECHVENQADVLHRRPREILQYGDEIQKLVVVSVREPTADGYGVLWVEDVRRRRIVNDYRVFEVTADHGKVLYVVPAMVEAAFAEQAVVNDFVYVELVQQWIAILCLVSTIQK